MATNNRLTTRKYNEVRALWFTTRNRQANEVLKCDYTADRSYVTWHVALYGYDSITGKDSYSQISPKMTYSEIKAYLQS